MDILFFLAVIALWLGLGAVTVLICIKADPENAFICNGESCPDYRDPIRRRHCGHYSWNHRDGYDNYKPYRLLALEIFSILLFPVGLIYFIKLSVLNENSRLNFFEKYRNTVSQQKKLKMPESSEEVDLKIPKKGDWRT